MAIKFVDRKYLEKYCYPEDLDTISRKVAALKEHVGPVPPLNSAALLRTGAKLDLVKRGCVVRYMVLGYAWDGSDVPEC